MKKTLLLSLSILALGTFAQASTIVNCLTSPSTVNTGNTDSPVILACQPIDAGAGFVIGSLQLQLAGDYQNGNSGGTTVLLTFTPDSNFGVHTEIISGGFSSNGVAYDGGSTISPNPGYTTVETISIATETLAGFNIDVSSLVTSGSVATSAVDAQLIYTAVDTTGAPEPATLGLMGSALVGLGFLARKKRKQ